MICFVHALFNRLVHRQESEQEEPRPLGPVCGFVLSQRAPERRKAMWEHRRQHEAFLTQYYEEREKKDEDQGTPHRA